MVEVRLNRDLKGKFQKVTEDLQEYGQFYGQLMAEDLVYASPVDTGAFMESYYVSTAYDGAGVSSRNRPRQQPWSAFGPEAIARMNSQVAALRGTTRMVFGNASPHAFQVEYKHGYAPFGKAANRHSERMQEAWNMAGLG